MPQRLLSAGLPVEFYLEAGRSRSGFLRRPKIGLLSMCAELLAGEEQQQQQQQQQQGEGSRSPLAHPQSPPTFDDILVLPVALSYDHVPEAKAYAAQLLGARKAKEGPIALAASLLRTAAAAAYARVAAAAAAAAAAGMGSANDSDSDSDSDRGNTNSNSNSNSTAFGPPTATGGAYVNFAKPVSLRSFVEAEGGANGNARRAAAAAATTWQRSVALAATVPDSALVAAALLGCRGFGQGFEVESKSESKNKNKSEDDDDDDANDDANDDNDDNDDNDNEEERKKISIPMAELRRRCRWLARALESRGVRTAAAWTRRGTEREGEGKGEERSLLRGLGAFSFLRIGRGSVSFDAGSAHAALELCFYRNALAHVFVREAAAAAAMLAAGGGSKGSQDRAAVEAAAEPGLCALAVAAPYAFGADEREGEGWARAAVQKGMCSLEEMGVVVPAAAAAATESSSAAVAVAEGKLFVASTLAAIATPAVAALAAVKRVVAALDREGRDDNGDDDDNGDNGNNSDGPLWRRAELALVEMAEKEVARCGTAPPEAASREALANAVAVVAEGEKERLRRTRSGRGAPTVFEGWRTPR